MQLYVNYKDKALQYQLSISFAVGIFGNRLYKPYIKILLQRIVNINVGIAPSITHAAIPESPKRQRY